MTGDITQQKMQRIESLLRVLEAQADSTTVKCVRELVQALLDVHGTGLARILKIISHGREPGLAIVAELAQDDLIGSLFLLHDLHPIDLQTRVTHALNRLQPQLRAHGGEAELVSLDDGVVHVVLRVEDDPALTSLKLALEEVIVAAAPDARAIEIQTLTGVTNVSPGRVPLPLLDGRT